MFAEVLDACSDGALPENLASALEEKHGVTAAASSRAANVLLRSGAFAGVIDRADSVDRVLPAARTPLGPFSGPADENRGESPLQGLVRRGALLYDQAEWHVEPIDFPLPDEKRGHVLIVVPRDLDREGYDKLAAKVSQWIADLRDHMARRSGSSTLPFASKQPR